MCESSVPQTFIAAAARAKDVLCILPPPLLHTMAPGRFCFNTEYIPRVANLGWYNITDALAFFD